MQTFTDLIKSGVAPSPYKTNVISNETDRFIINYNNIWGIISDTHMSKGEDGRYYITGQLFKNKDKTCNFIYAWSWGAYNFKNSSLGYSSLKEYCDRNYKTISHEIVNGDDVLVLTEFTEEQREYYDKYYGATQTDGQTLNVDWKRREKGEEQNTDVARSLNFVY